MFRFILSNFNLKYIFKLEFPTKQETIHQARKVVVGMLLQRSSGFGPKSP